MIYQVRVNILLTSFGQAQGLYNHCAGIFPLATSINLNNPHAEYSSIELIENHHDTDPAEPCILLDSLFNSPPPPE